MSKFLRKLYTAFVNLRHQFVNFLPATSNSHNWGNLHICHLQHCTTWCFPYLECTKSWANKKHVCLASPQSSEWTTYRMLIHYIMTVVCNCLTSCVGSTCCYFTLTGAIQFLLNPPLTIASLPNRSPFYLPYLIHFGSFPFPPRTWEQHIMLPTLLFSISFPGGEFGP